MTLRIFSVDHARHGLDEVSRVSASLQEVTRKLDADLAVRGFLSLNTCNRVSLWVDAEHPSDVLEARLSQALGHKVDWEIHEQQDALRHGLRVASGLESMVVGEREIAGQLKRAYNEAKERKSASPVITLAAEEALKAARSIANATGLSGFGRSIVSVGLDALGIEDWTAQTVLLVGTGSYAGAAIAQLKRRGACDVMVHSSSGRGAEFAAQHDCEAVDTVEQGIADASLIVTSRGLGGYVITPDDIAGPMKIIDLSLHRDVDPRVGDLPDVTLIDLATIQTLVTPTDDLAAADEIVDKHLAQATIKMRTRAIDPGVVELRQQIMSIVDEEVERLPDHELTKDDAARALRRLAARMLHIPSVRAKQAAADGHAALYMQALEVLYGISPGLKAEVDENERCPVVGLAVNDLEE